MRTRFFLIAPCHPISRMTRSTVHRATSNPVPRSIIHVFRVPRTRVRGLFLRSMKIASMTCASVSIRTLGPRLMWS